MDGTTRYLMLISWNILLGRMSNAAGESPTQRDIDQLRGLADRIDGDAFLPLRSEELAPTFPRCVLDFNRLIDEAINFGRSRGWISTRVLQASSNRAGTGRYIRLFGIEAWFAVRFHLWARSRDTPLWMRLRGVGKNRDIRHRLDAIQRELESPDDRASVPIDLPTRVEYDTVLDSVVTQLEHIGQTINPDYKVSKQ